MHRPILISAMNDEGTTAQVRSTESSVFGGNVISAIKTQQLRIMIIQVTNGSVLTGTESLIGNMVLLDVFECGLYAQ